ncbi:MAG: helical backbone metal receptor [Dehalococcoidia bacterium]
MRRIVSLVPSLTELVVWLDRGSELAGRSRFCTEPIGAVERVPIVGGTKNPKIDRIDALEPTLILANKEENRREDIEALRARGHDVVLTDPNSVDEAVAMILTIGELLDAQAKAQTLAEAVASALKPAPEASVRTFVPIWKDPWMALGSATYGHDLLTRCGASNVFADHARYPETTLDAVASRRPELILMPDEPYPFKGRDAEALTAIAPARVIDGKLLWWYGPRMPEAIHSLRTLFAEVRR